jgi:hypothetical protein
MLDSHYSTIPTKHSRTMDKPLTTVTQATNMTKETIGLPTAAPNEELADLYKPPYAYSGNKIDTLEGSTELSLGSRTINLFAQDDGKEYVAIDNRLIPYKDWNKTPDLTLSQAVSRLRDDFYNSAESGINVRRSPEQIDHLKKMYDNPQIDEHHKRPLGAIIMGSMIERLNELAPTIEQRSKDLEPARILTSAAGLSETGNGAILDVIQNTPEFKEASAHARYLFEHPDLSSSVRTRTYGTDKDERFYELMTEVTKAFNSVNPDSAVERNFNRATKIAKAMDGIEEIGKTMMEMSKELPASSNKYDNLREGVTDIVEQFANTARMRVGIRSDDHPAYEIATIQYKAAKDALQTVYKNAHDLTETEQTHVASRSKTSRAITHITKGIDLIDDMSRMRNDLPESRASYIRKAHIITAPAQENARGI